MKLNKKIERFYYLLPFALIFMPSLAQAQNVPGQAYGGNKNDIGLTLCETNDSGFLFAGTTRSSGAGSNDIYLIRIQKDGSPLWSYIYGGFHQDFARSVIALEDGFMIAGESWNLGFGNLDEYLMKLDLTGNLVWKQSFGTNSVDRGFKVIQSENKGYYLLGYTRGIEPAGDIYLIKTDENGNQEWAKNYGAEEDTDDYGFDLVQMDDDNIFIVGTKAGFFDDIHRNFKYHDADIYLFKVDKNGNEIWQKTFGGNEHDFGQAICSAKDGGLYLFGSTQNNAVGSFDMVLIKTDTSGNEIWRKTYGGEDYEYGMSIDRNMMGDLYLFGTTKSFGENGSADYYLIKTDKDGNKLWSITIGGDSIELGHQVKTTPDEGCMVIGQTKSFGNGGYDFLVTKINKNGIVEYLFNATHNAYSESAFVYPNPLSGYGKVKIDSNLQSNNFRMEITSLSGNLSRSFTITPPDYHFSVVNLAPGIYIYKIVSEINAAIMFKGKIIIY